MPRSFLGASLCAGEAYRYHASGLIASSARKEGEEFNHDNCKIITMYVGGK